MIFPVLRSTRSILPAYPKCAIYAPYADVKAYVAVEIFGAVVAESFLQSVDADFHYDASLRDVDITDVGVTFEIDRWWEN